jgi:hypothetical protein
MSAYNLAMPALPLCWFSHGPQLTFSHSPAGQLLVNSTSFQLCHLPDLTVSLPVSSATALSLHLVILLLVSF